MGWLRMNFSDLARSRRVDTDAEPAGKEAERGRGRTASGRSAGGRWQVAFRWPADVNSGVVWVVYLNHGVGGVVGDLLAKRASD